MYEYTTSMCSKTMQHKRCASKLCNTSDMLVIYFKAMAHKCYISKPCYRREALQSNETSVMQSKTVRHR